MTSRLEFAEHLTKRGLTKSGVEIGVLFGEYSRHLLANWPGKLYMVDPWVQQPAEAYLDGCNSVNMEKAMAKTVAAVAEFGPRAKILRMFSLDAVKLFADGQLDFVYLDGNHAAESIRADLRAWWPKIRKGGVLGGHDFYERHDDWHECGVKTAVEEFVAERSMNLVLTPECTSWWIDKITD